MADFEKGLTALGRQNIKVLAASTDTLENARGTLDRLKLTFPLAYGLDGKKVSELIGSFFEEEHGYLHSTNFIIRPDGRVAEALYSTGPIGRFTVVECVGMVKYFTREGK